MNDLNARWPSTGHAWVVGDKADMIDRIDMRRESAKEVEVISNFRSWVRGEHMNVENSRNKGRDDWKERSWGMKISTCEYISIISIISINSSLEP